MARASEKSARVQPCAWVMGWSHRPKPCRMPIDSVTMRALQASSCTSGRAGRGEGEAETGGVGEVMGRGRWPVPPIGSWAAGTGKEKTEGCRNSCSQGIAYREEGAAITRDRLKNTEAGEGDSRIKGYQASLSAQYGIAVSPSTLVSPGVTLTHRNVIRDGYTETRNAEFAATYGKMGNTRTDLQMGVNGVHQLNETVQLGGNLGATVKLHSERDAFTGSIPYIGAYAYDAGDERNVSLYATAGVNVNVTKNSTVRANVGWQQTDYRHDAANVGVSYSYHW